jgi:peptide-methionine (S)-S-oxide reductase
MEKATFAAGCFWGIEEEFASIKGVIQTNVGYTGGMTVNPSYEEVCLGKTGHVEAVELIFDPQIVSYENLLDVFWQIHDPTTLNSQGLDVGTQYKSVIFYHNKEQYEKALKSKEKIEKSGPYKNEIVTEIIPVQTFYKAEEYHQQYYKKKNSGNCSF